MNKQQFLLHWHNIRSSSRPREYGIPEIVALRFAHTPGGEMTYGWEWGHLSKMQQPFMRRRQCPTCGIFRKEREKYYHWIGEHERIITCCHCHPEATKCTSCGCYCSPYEVSETNGLCYDCSPRDDDEDDWD